MLTPRRVALLLAAALAAYLLLVGVRAVALIRTGEPVAIGLGVAVLALPVLGAWLLWRELAFGFGMQRMGRALADEDGLPEADLPLLPSGRVDRDAADARFAERRAEVEAAPGDWRAWYRLGIAYDDARDRKRARAAMRHALTLFDG